jgi:hypothetical protein
VTRVGRTVVAALVAVLVCVAGGRPGTAADVSGTKVFRNDCTMTMTAERLEGGDSVIFSATDAGDGCDGYYLRSISAVATSGARNVETAARFDAQPEHDLEAVGALVAGAFAYGTVNVYVPYRQRCHRYQMTAAGEVRLLDSRPCSGDPYPPRTKVFRRDCALNFHVEGTRGGAFFAASEAGSECGDYVLRGISAVTATGGPVAAGLSDGDGDPDPDLEALSVSFGFAGFAYGQVNVYVPYRARCDRYRFSEPPFGPPVIQLVGSSPCGDATT